MYNCLTRSLRMSFCPSVVGSAWSSVNSHIQSHCQVSNTSVLPATMMCLPNKWTKPYRLQVDSDQTSSRLQAYRKLFIWPNKKQNKTKKNQRVTVNMSATFRYLQWWTKALGTLMYWNELSVFQNWSLNLKNTAILLRNWVKNALLFRFPHPMQCWNHRY